MTTRQFDALYDCLSDHLGERLKNVRSNEEGPFTSDALIVEWRCRGRLAYCAIPVPGSHVKDDVFTQTVNDLLSRIREVENEITDEQTAVA